MHLLHIIGVLFLGTLLLERPKSALSDRGGNNGRQLEVVSHAPSYNFDRLQPILSPRRSQKIRRYPLKVLANGGAGFDAQLEV
jgi:hypothetical protein